MHSQERLVQELLQTPVTSYTGFAYRVVPEKWRESPLSAIGSVAYGGRYNAPNAFPILYCADSQLTAMMEVEALFMTADGRLKGAPRNPDLVLSVQCELRRVLDLTSGEPYARFGTSRDELINSSPSRFILNARGKLTPTQELGAACAISGKISALKVPSAANPAGFCLNMLMDSLITGERVAILDSSGRIRGLAEGIVPDR